MPDSTADEDALPVRRKCSSFVAKLFCGDSIDLRVATGNWRVRLRHGMEKPKSDQNAGCARCPQGPKIMVNGCLMARYAR